MRGRWIQRSGYFTVRGIEIEKMAILPNRVMKGWRYAGTIKRGSGFCVAPQNACQLVRGAGGEDLEPDVCTERFDVLGTSSRMETRPVGQVP
jgi:hypothetical protein